MSPTSARAHARPCAAAAARAGSRIPAPAPAPAPVMAERRPMSLVEAKQVYGMQWAKFSRDEKQLILRGELAKEL